jgi:hypothetical protein
METFKVMRYVKKSCESETYFSPDARFVYEIYNYTLYTFDTFQNNEKALALPTELSTSEFLCARSVDIYHQVAIFKSESCVKLVSMRLDYDGKNIQVLDSHDINGMNTEGFEILGDYPKYAIFNASRNTVSYQFFNLSRIGTIQLAQLANVNCQPNENASNPHLYENSIVFLEISTVANVWAIDTRTREISMIASLGEVDPHSGIFEAAWHNQKLYYYSQQSVGSPDASCTSPMVFNLSTNTYEQLSEVNPWPAVKNVYSSKGILKSTPDGLLTCIYNRTVYRMPIDKPDLLQNTAWLALKREFLGKAYPIPHEVIERIQVGPIFKIGYTGSKISKDSEIRYTLS